MHTYSNFERKMVTEMVTEANISNKNDYRTLSLRRKSVTESVTESVTQAKISPNLFLFK